MGSVKHDIFIREKKYHLNSMSNEEDVFKTLWMLDQMVYDSLNDNKEALVQLIDFYEALPPSNKAIHEYIAIQTGASPLQVSYEIEGIYVKNEISLFIAKRLGITKEECELQLLEGVKHMIDYNSRKWFKVIGKKMHYGYKEAARKVFYQTNNKENITAIKKKGTVQGSACEDAMQYIGELEKSISENQKRLKELRAKKERNHFEKEELNKRIKYDKQLYEDLNIIKGSYGIGGRTNDIVHAIRTIEKSGYSDEILIDDNSHCMNESHENLTYAWQTEKIKNLAHEELTERQYIIFYLYYFCGLTQQTIGMLLKDSKGNICTQIQKVIKKIQSKIEQQNFLGNVTY